MKLRRAPAPKWDLHGPCNCPAWPDELSALQLVGAPCSAPRGEAPAEGRVLTPPAPCPLSWPAEAGRIVRTVAAAHEGTRRGRLPAGGARLTTGKRDRAFLGCAVIPPPSSLLRACVPGSRRGLCTGPCFVLPGPGQQGSPRDASGKAGLSPQYPERLPGPLGGMAM